MINKELLMVAGGTEVGELTLTIGWYITLPGVQFIKVYRNNSLVYTVKPRESIQPVEVAVGDSLRLETHENFYITLDGISSLTNLGNNTFLVNNVPCHISLHMNYRY